MELLVSAGWLAERLSDSDVVILDATLPPVGVVPKVDTHARYVAEHLPGAVFFDIDALSDHSSGLPHTMPSADSFARNMSALGVDEGMAVVVYEQDGVFSAPRCVWMLRSMGARNVRLLDGGLAAWKAAGYSTEQGEVIRPAGNFHARLEPRAVTSFTELQGVIASHGQILDARAAGRFDGTTPEPRPGLSAGHMPGATSLPYTELVKDGRLKSPAEIRVVFEQKRVDLQAPIVTTCGSGVTAAVISLALELAGAENTSLYDGSWAEYGQHPHAVIEKTVPN